MYWVPQPVSVVAPAAPAVVGFDAHGQGMVHQPMQVIGFLPTFAAAGASYFAGFAQGVAGLALGSATALSGSSTGRGPRRARRQQRQARQAEAQQEPSVPEHWQDNELADDLDEPSSAPASPKVRSPASGPHAEHHHGLLTQLEEGGEARAGALATIRGSVLDLAFDSVGCRVIQTALDVTSLKDGAELASELRGHIREAIESKHANYVVQKIVEVLPTSMVSFVVEELAGDADEV